MLSRAVFSTLALLAVTSMTALAAPKDDLAAAINKTAQAPNYSWATSVQGGFGSGKTTGKTENNGYTQLTLPMRDQSFDVFIKDHKAAIKTDDGWKSASELTADQGGGFSPERFAAMIALNYKTPLAQAQEVLNKLQDVKADGDTYTATLTEAAVKDMMTFRRVGNRRAPDIKDAKGSIKVWTSDGLVTKAEYHVTGTINFRGEDRDIDRTTTVQLSDLGSTKIDVPPEAKKILTQENGSATAPQ